MSQLSGDHRCTRYNILIVLITNYVELLKEGIDYDGHDEVVHQNDTKDVKGNEEKSNPQTSCDRLEADLAIRPVVDD